MPAGILVRHLICDNPVKDLIWLHMSLMKSEVLDTDVLIDYLFPLF